MASAAVGLRFGGCVGDLSGCARTSTVGALDGAEAVAVSGSNVYVAAASGNALSHFRLDSAGKPSFVGCIGDLSGCAKTSPGGALDGASGVAVRRGNLYVNAGEAVSHFTLDSAGKPRFVGCIGDLAGCTAISNPDAFELLYLQRGGQGKHSVRELAPRRELLHARLGRHPDVRRLHR